MVEGEQSIGEHEGSDGPLWKSVIETLGFRESWERAREQARRGETVSADEIEKTVEQFEPTQFFGEGILRSDVSAEGPESLGS